MSPREEKEGEKPEGRDRARGSSTKEDRGRTGGPRGSGKRSVRSGPITSKGKAKRKTERKAKGKTERKAKGKTERKAKRKVTRRSAQKDTERHEIELAMTRRATTTDEKKIEDDTDPGELVGMGKIGDIPPDEVLEMEGQDGGEDLEDLREEPIDWSGPGEVLDEENLEELDEPSTESMREEHHTVELSGPGGEEPYEPGRGGGRSDLDPDGEEDEAEWDLPPGPKRLVVDEIEGEDEAGEVMEDLEEEEEVSLDEISFERDGRRIRVRTLSALQRTDLGDAGVKEERPGPTSRHRSDTDPRAVEGTSRSEKGSKDAVRVSTDLGLDVELDRKKIERLKRPLLPLEFSYSGKFLHRRFRRSVLMLIIPATVYFLIFVYLGPDPMGLLMATLILVAFLANLVVYGISPFYSTHQVSKRGILLRLGLYFKAFIPLEMISSVSTTDRSRFGPGINRRGSDTLSVLTERRGMVKMDLMKPEKVGPGGPVKAVIVNVDEPDAFVRTVREARSYYHEMDDEV